MSSYTLNKMLREVNRNSHIREQFFKSPDAVAAEFELTEEERDAFLRKDVGALYRLGAHGLILRPFTLLQGMPEPEYLSAIRDKAV
jgi:hypothetical protein